MRRLWLLLLAIVAGAMRSWVGFWYRVAQAVKRRLTAAQETAKDGQSAVGDSDRPPAQWLARARRDEPPAHWSAYVRSRAPGLTFPHYRTPIGPPPYPQDEGEPARSSGDSPNWDGLLAPPAGEPATLGRRRAEVSAVPAGPRPANEERQEASRGERSAPPSPRGTKEAPPRQRRQGWSPLEWARAVVKPRLASRPPPRPEKERRDRGARFEPGMPGEALAPEGRPGEPEPERIAPVPRGVEAEPSEVGPYPEKWPALPGEEAYVRGKGGAGQPFAPLDAAGARGVDGEGGEGLPYTVPPPDAREKHDDIPRQRGRTAHPEPARDLTARRWPELPEAGDWAADPPRNSESVEDTMRAWRRRQRLDQEQKGVLWNESLY